MSFKSLSQFIIYSFILLLSACSDSDNEDVIVDLFAAASLDLIEISFPADTNEDVISVSSFFDYNIDGLKSNGIDRVPVTTNTDWSLSDGAQSTIDQSGRLTAGSVAENLTITAKVGHLTASFDVRISAAKFDQVIELNSTAVSLNMCQEQRIVPIGNYINDDGSPDEQRSVDSSVINTIEWTIRNEGDGSASQRAFINTENNLVYLQAYETGDVIIQATAPSVSQGGTLVTSREFEQTLANNLNDIKICLESDTNLATCTLSDNDVVENNVVSLIAVGNYNLSNGGTVDENISEFSKWGINNSNASIAFSADRQQLNVTGETTETTTTTTEISVACGKIEQTIVDADLETGVVLDEAVSCAIDSAVCFQTTETMDILPEIVETLSVTVNDVDLENNIALALSSRPAELVFEVTANFTNGTSRVVTEETAYTNISTDVVTEINTKKGEYTVLDTGNDVEIQMSVLLKTFIAKVTLPN